MRCYSELIQLPTIEERYRYLKLANIHVGKSTFGSDRYLNQRLYRSDEWYKLRYKIVIRDGGNDLAMEGYPVRVKGMIHHINPLTPDQLIHGDDCIFDPENLILCSFDTHNAIHYGNDSLIPQPLVERRPGDTCLWR